MFAISAGHCKGERFCGRCVSLRAVGKGEGVTQSVPPNLAAELGRRWMFACVDRGPRKVPQRSEDTLWGIMAKASRRACRRTSPRFSEVADQVV